MNRSNHNQFSVQEYINYEIESGLKHEFHDGKIYEIKEESLNHGMICGNIYYEIRQKIRTDERDFIPLIKGVKLYINELNCFVYPDSIVVHKEIQQSKIDENSIINPKLLIEVLSENTSSYDLGDKFYMYRQIPNLEEYVMIKEKENIVDVFYRKENNDFWKITRFEGLNKNVRLDSLNIEVKMAKVYHEVNLKNN